MVLHRSSPYASKASWKHNRLGDLGYPSSGSTRYPRALALFETSPVRDGSVAFSRCEHSFGFLGFPVVDHQIRRRRHSSLFRKDGRRPVPWALRCRLSGIHEEDAAMARSTKVDERIATVRPSILLPQKRGKRVYVREANSPSEVHVPADANAAAEQALGYDLIMINIILKGVIALRACG